MSFVRGREERGERRKEVEDSLGVSINAFRLQRETEKDLRVCSLFRDVKFGDRRVLSHRARMMPPKMAMAAGIIAVHGTL